MLLFLTSLIAGVLTVLAPCTIALLPVIVGGTLAGGTSSKRAITVTASLGVSVIAFTFLLKVSTLLINVPPAAWQILSGGLIGLIGLTFLFPAPWERISLFSHLNKSGNRVLASGYMHQSLWGDVLVGAALGPVFSSCSPTYFLIIAMILPASLAAGALDLLAYAIGLCGMLFIVSVAGQRLLKRFGAASDPRVWWRRAIGALFILLGLAIALGYEQKFELAFANANVINMQGIERALLGTGRAVAPSASAPEITSPAGFINTSGQPITIGQYKGKDVVLVDFWDYSCINCEREIPYVEAWWQKYKDEGLVVIGVHTPEFSFEKLQSNVAMAVQSLGITYPVVLDNDYGTWNAFGNEYWPQIYLINADGQIVYSHSGEGDYAATEAALQQALVARDQELGLSDTVSTGTVAPAGAVEVNGAELNSPETYFGSDRNEYLANGAQGVPGVQTLTLPSAPELNSLYVSGVWSFTPEYAETSDPKGAIEYQFDAKDVYMVATGNPSATMTILLDGKPIPAADAGSDVSGSVMTVTADRLYKIVHLPDYGIHTLEIKIERGTLDAYTFTFG